MAECKFCGREMTTAPGCTLAVYSDFADGIARDRIRFGDEFRDHTPQWRCHDCNASAGELHHPGCDVERCPRCGEQAIGCECIESAEPVDPWETPEWPLYCRDCRVDCSAIAESYMVHDAVWAASGLAPDGGVLCVGCLEQRIGRRLVPQDFVPGAYTGSPRSARLQSRREP